MKIKQTIIYGVQELTNTKESLMQNLPKEETYNFSLWNLIWIVPLVSFLIFFYWHFPVQLIFLIPGVLIISFGFLLS